MIKKKYKLYAWILASVTVLATSCTDNSDFIGANPDSTEETELFTFTIKPQAQNIATRAGDEVGDGPDMNFRISDGSRIDVLKYAVYESEDYNPATKTGTFTLAPEFKKGNVTLGNVTSGKGQNVMEVNVSSWPLKLQFAFNPFKYYKVVFWAQNRETSVFETSDLEKVVVTYTGALNNDELRDAFCAVSDVVTLNSTGSAKEVMLKRPFAQINVATSGWDYESVADLDPERVMYTQSTIRVEGVADRINLLTGKADTKDGKESMSVDFSYNRMPAFIHYAPGTYPEIYSNTSLDEFLMVHRGNYTNYVVENENKGGEYFGYVTWKKYRDFKTGMHTFNNRYFEKKSVGFTNYAEEVLVPSGEEEQEEFFQKVEDEIYLTSDKLFTEEYGSYRPATEMFKYLSMCYVLVPAEDYEAGGSTVDVKFNFRGNGIKIEDGKQTVVSVNDIYAGEKQDDGSSAFITVKTVPVQRNWRTNLLSDNFFTFNEAFKLYVIPDYCGEYNYDADKEDDPNLSDQENYKDRWNVGMSGKETDTSWTVDKGNGRSGFANVDFSNTFGDYYGEGSKPGPDRIE